jgi:hypothetical protein
MTQNLLLKAASTINRLYLPFCVLFLVALLYNHVQLITYKVPLDYNEAGMLAITAAIAAGENPYALENQPALGSGYPVLYNIFVAVASKGFGNTLVLHRAIVGIFILASCLLIFLVTNKISQSPQNSFAASILLYAGLLYYATPIASPTSLGLFLFLSSLIIPWMYGFSNRSLLAALVLGVMAFYGKQYCVASLGYIALYLFIAVSKKKGLVFAVLSLCLFVASLALVNRTSPYFLDNAVFAVRFSAALFSSNQTMLNQLLEYGQMYLPLLMIVAIQLLLKDFAGNQTRGQSVPESGGQGLVNLTDPDAPLFKRKPDYIWYCFACSLVVIVFGIGKHPGNHLSYLFQILSPFLLAGIFISMSRAIKLTWIYQILVFAAFYNSYSSLPQDFSLETEHNWEKLERMISTADHVYASPIVIGLVLKSGGEIFNDGHTNYFSGVPGQQSFPLHENPEETVEQVWEKHVNRIFSMIAAQEFDLIILDQWIPVPNHRPDSNVKIDGTSMLQQYYRRREVIPISLANRPGAGKYAMQIWEPLPNPSHLGTKEP